MEVTFVGCWFNVNMAAFLQILIVSQFLHNHGCQLLVVDVLSLGFIEH